MINEYIGTAKDNMNSAIHNWYKFTAGFSYKFVDVLVGEMEEKPHCIYEPFAGCGTTLVEAQKLGIRSVGNESQLLMCEIINAKLNWNIDKKQCAQIIDNILAFLDSYHSSLASEFHPLLCTLYDPKSLEELYLIRNYIKTVDKTEYRQFLNLALSQVLHKSAIYPIAVPYIVRTKKLANPGHVRERFVTTVNTMLHDIESQSQKCRYAEVFNMDSREQNKNIKNGSCDLCITSPPYLNNLDYGEVSKVHTHFFGITSNWRDITEKVRKDLVTGATTHYKDSDFDLHEFENSEFARNNINLMIELKSKYYQLGYYSEIRKGRKSFHILMMHYFEDMYKVLKEMRRVLKPNAKAFLILGDSAPYGVYIPTTQYLGEIALCVGFKEYRISKIRNRGTKWAVKTRHNIELSENILELC